MSNTVRVGIQQPNFFPWLGYFHKMKMSDVFIILDTVDIELGSSKAITHRTKIKSINGKHAWLTLPLQKDGSKLIKDIQLDDLDDWKNKSLELLRQYYRKAPCFQETYAFIEKCFESSKNFEGNLCQYNTAIIKHLTKQLEIDAEIVLASELNAVSEDRNERLIELIKEVNGTVYISGRGGKTYHNEDLFLQENIKIDYLNFQHPVYPQLHGEFIQGLSVIDYLMNDGF